MQRKSAINIRTSSEFQGEKASPAEQEVDCRFLAKEKGLTVVRVYRDIEKYRVKNKLVEPSGLRQLRDEQVLLTKERQEFITHARVTRMNQEELSQKIAVHYEKAARVERRETAIEDELNAYADLDFDARVSAYVQDLQADPEDVINANPQSDEERHALFLRKRRYIDDLLEEVVIDGDRQIHVKFRADVLCLVQGNKVV